MIVPQKSSKKVPYGQKKARHRQIHSDLVFALALCAMLASEGDLNRATVWFKKVAPRPRPQHLKEFLLRVWNRYKDGAIPISARAPPKRRKKINKEEAEHAGDLLLQGTQGRSGWRPLANAKEACYENPELKKMVQQKDVSPTYLWRRAKAENKKLTRSRVVFKPTRFAIFQREALQDG
ncbi:hypothetical protein Ndes2437B_g03625 [Nannochloris sp. 'desiccata']